MGEKRRLPSFAKAGRHGSVPRKPMFAIPS
jgi:hypothetical protein